MIPDIELATAAEIDELNQGVSDVLLEDELRKLAAFNPIEYDRCRENVAKRLGIRVPTLDAEVEKRRPKADSTAGMEGRMLLSDPEPWPNAVNLEFILNETLAAVRRFVIVSESAAVAVALWIMYTYWHDSANVSPILAITSPEKRCGKTTLLELLTALVLRPLPTANVTAAAIYRGIETYHPTLLIDEADTFITTDANELRGILNSGHRRSAAIVLRTVGEAHELRKFSTWCAKAIATIGKLPDTLQDRSIGVSMRRRAAEESVDRMRFDRVAKELEPLRRQAKRWSADNGSKLATAEPVMPTGIDDRAADNWAPLVAIADAAGSDWGRLARQAAVELCGAREQDDESARTQLLADIRQLYTDQETDRLTSAAIVSALAEMEDRPWPEWKSGKPITVRQLANLLKPFRIQPRNVRMADAVIKGYLLDQFSDAFTRYLPPAYATPLQPSNDNGSNRLQAATWTRNVADEKKQNSQAVTDVADVADQPPGSQEEKRI